MEKQKNTNKKSFHFYTCSSFSFLTSKTDQRPMGYVTGKRYRDCFFWLKFNTKNSKILSYFLWTSDSLSVYKLDIVPLISCYLSFIKIYFIFHFFIHPTLFIVDSVLTFFGIEQCVIYKCRVAFEIKIYSIWFLLQ